MARGRFLAKILEFYVFSFITAFFYLKDFRRCYGHGENMMFSFKPKCYVPNFVKTSSILNKKRILFRQIFMRKYFKNQSIGPRFKTLHVHGCTYVKRVWRRSQLPILRYLNIELHTALA
jgi:hypothetical protein